MCRAHQVPVGCSGVLTSRRHGPQRLTPERPPRPSAPHVDVADAVVVVLEELRSPAAPILVAHGPPGRGRHRQRRTALRCAALHRHVWRCGSAPHGAGGQPAGRACIRSIWTASKSRAAGSSSAIRALPTDVNCVRTDGCPRDRARPGREYTGGCGTGRQALRRRVRWHTAWYPAARYPARHGRLVPESTHAEPSRQAVPRACRQSPRTPPPPPPPHHPTPPPLLPLPLKCMPPSTIANMGCQAADERTHGKGAKAESVKTAEPNGRTCRRGARG